MRTDMNEQDELAIERSSMRIVGRGLRLKIGAMLLLYVGLIVLLFVLIFFPEMAFEDYSFLYAMGTVLTVIMIDLLGRIFCLSWPKDQPARLSVIGSSACQIGAIVVLIIGAIEGRGDDSFVRGISFGGFLIVAFATQVASAVLFMGYTRRVCKVLGRDDLAWRPSVVLAAYGLSGASAVSLLIVSVLLLIVLWFFCCGGLYLYGPLHAFALQIKLAGSGVVLLLVFFPFRSYGWFLFQLAQAIDKWGVTREVVVSQIVDS